MTIYTTLKDNGDAHIKEIWQMDVHEGTEVYKVMKKMKDKKIQNLKVSDEKGTQYENIGAWVLIFFIDFKITIRFKIKN